MSWLNMYSLTHISCKYLPQDQPYQQSVKEGEGSESPTFYFSANDSWKSLGEGRSLSLAE